jgi:hypothetical protein
MKIVFMHDDDARELVATGKETLGLDGPISAVYEPGEHGYYATIERRLSPLGKLAVDIACAELDGQVTIRLTADGAIVFSPVSMDAGEQTEIFNRLCENFNKGARLVEAKTLGIFGEGVEPPALSFVGKNFLGLVPSS